MPIAKPEQSGRQESSGTRSPARTTTGLPTAELFAILWFSSLFVLELGIKNGELNQVFYLLHGLRLADPTFLKGDLYANAVSHHVPWDLAIDHLARAGLLNAGLAAGTIVMMLAFTVATYAAMRALYDHPLLPWALSLMLFAGFFTRGLGDMFLLPSSIEPFGIGGVAMIVGLAFLAWERPLAGGVSWGVGAYMHPHFAILILAILALTTIVQSRRVPIIYLLKIWLPFLVFGTPSLLRVHAFAVAPQGTEMYRIFSAMAPQHYFPWHGDWRPLALFAATGLMAFGGVLLRPPRWNLPLFLPLGSSALMVVGSLALDRAGWFDALRPGLPWRLSSLLMLAGVAAGSAALGSGPKPLLTRRSVVAWSALAAALAIFLLAGTPRLWLAVLAAVAVVVVNPIITRLLAHYSDRHFPVTLAPFLVISLGMAPVAYIGLRQSHLDIRPVEAARSGLYHWARVRTAPGSVFVVPPQWKDFRLTTGRAVVAEWSSVPLYPPDFMDWYQRFRDVTGLDRPYSLAASEAGYAQLDCRRSELLHRRYHARYFVIALAHPLPCGTVAYQDDAYQVLDYAP